MIDKNKEFITNKNSLSYKYKIIKELLIKYNLYSLKNQNIVKENWNRFNSFADLNDFVLKLDPIIYNRYSKLLIVGIIYLIINICLTYWVDNINEIYLISSISIIISLISMFFISFRQKYIDIWNTILFITMILFSIIVIIVSSLITRDIYFKYGQFYILLPSIIIVIYILLLVIKGAYEVKFINYDKMKVIFISHNMYNKYRYISKLNKEELNIYVNKNSIYDPYKIILIESSLATFCLLSLNILDLLNIFNNYFKIVMLIYSIIIITFSIYFIIHIYKYKCYQILFQIFMFLSAFYSFIIVITGYNTIYYLNNIVIIECYKQNNTILFYDSNFYLIDLVVATFIFIITIVFEIRENSLIKTEKNIADNLIKK